MKKISIIDYGLSNIFSVEHAFNSFHVPTEIINSPDQIMDANVLVLPGVGAFENGMNKLNNLNLINPLKEKVSSGIPLLGICLGMQMLFDQSEEFGLHKGLGFIHGNVIRIPSTDSRGNTQKVPHISWDPLFLSDSQTNFEGTILQDIIEGEECYFIHSYEAIPNNPQNRLADTMYGGKKICAVAYKGNVYGTQFHPEKSGKVGLRILRNFIEQFCL